MKLTNQQITTIEQTLVLNGVVYDDIKLEILDHIASDIEAEVISQERPFETVLKEVFEKWKPQLRPTSHNLLLGYSFSAPKIISDKLADEAKKELFAAGIIVSLFTILILLINNEFEEPSLLSAIVFFLQASAVIGALLMISGKLCLLKSKINTTYLFRFKRAFYVILLYGLLIGFGCFPILPFNKSIEIKVFSLITTLIYLFLIYGSLKLFYKHFQFEKKLFISKS